MRLRSLSLTFLPTVPWASASKPLMLSKRPKGCQIGSGAASDPGAAAFLSTFKTKAAASRLADRLLLQSVGSDTGSPEDRTAGGYRAKEAEMKKILVTAAILLIGLSLATPALAGHHGYFRGHGDGWRNHAVSYPPKPRAFLSFGVDVPFYGLAGPYRPAPIYYDPYPIYAPPPSRHS